MRVAAQSSPFRVGLQAEPLRDGALRKQAALRALATAVATTRRYLANPLTSPTGDFVAQAEIAEQWARAASCLGGVGDWLLARKCYDFVRRWQQEHFDLNSVS